MLIMDISNVDFDCCQDSDFEDYYSDLDHNPLKFCKNCKTLIGNCSSCSKDSTYAIEIKTDNLTFEYSIAICKLCNEVSGFYHHWTKSMGRKSNRF